jgi:hypothetical protein
MGFSAIGPTPNVATALASIDMWSLRADAAIMHVDVQWAAMLAGTSAAAAAKANALDLSNYYRARKLPIVLMLDVTNGLARDREAPELVAAGRSITESAIQRLYRDVATPLYVSVQVETAWGRLAGSGPGTYIGIDDDLRDFPFIGALGLSSYPYLAGFATPETIPNDYYSRIRGSRTLPLMVVEGGWTSTAIGALLSSPEMQARYIRRQAELLDAAGAAAVFQLTFTDLDLGTIPQPPGSILPVFATLGMVDTQLRPKPALAVWDSVFARRRE